MTKKILMFLSASIVIIIFTLIFFIFFFLRYLSQKTNTSFYYFPKTFIAAHQHPTLLPGFNLIILGLDPRNDSLEKTNTTDTIIFSRLNSNLQIKLFSLPRDLWHYPLNTKINQIYPLSLNQNNQYRYIQNNFALITGQTLDRTLVITTQNLIELVKIVGGVDIYLDKGFKDDQYPNPEYIKNPTSKTPIYKTIEFPAGEIHLNETNITEFVRSRKSSETAADGGTDLGRIQRQQLLINALFIKFKSPALYKQPEQIIALYNFWHKEIQTNLTDQDLFSLILKINTKFDQISLNKIEISAGENPKVDLIYHPKVFINQQWVFIPQEKDYQSLKQYISRSLI